jgi:hypothetical protein
MISSGGFISGVGALSTHYVVGCVCPMASLDVVAEKFTPLSGMKTDIQVVGIYFTEITLLSLCGMSVSLISLYAVFCAILLFIISIVCFSIISPGILVLLKCVSLAGHVACVGEVKNTYNT